MCTLTISIEEFQYVSVLINVFNSTSSQALLINFFKVIIYNLLQDGIKMIFS
jgi:hypothetical protein